MVVPSTAQPWVQIQCAKACDDSEISIWDSNAESVKGTRRRSRVELRNGPLLYSPQRKKSSSRGTSTLGDKGGMENENKWTWGSLQDDDGYEDEDEDDDDDEFNWGIALGIFGFALPAVVIGIPWLVGHPMALTMALAVAPLLQRAVGFAASIWDSISKASSSNRRYKSRFATSGSSRFQSRKRTYRGNNAQREAEETDEEDESSYYRSWETKTAEADNPGGCKEATATGGWGELEADRKLMLKKYRTSRGGMSKYKRRKRLPLVWRVIVAIFPFLRSWGGLL